MKGESNRDVNNGITTTVFEKYTDMHVSVFEDHLIHTFKNYTKIRGKNLLIEVVVVF